MYWFKNIAPELWIFGLQSKWPQLQNLITNTNAPHATPTIHNMQHQCLITQCQSTCYGYGSQPWRANANNHHLTFKTSEWPNQGEGSRKGLCVGIWYFSKDYIHACGGPNPKTHEEKIFRGRQHSWFFYTGKCGYAQGSLKQLQFGKLKRKLFKIFDIIKWF